MAIFACSSELSPSLALGTISLGTVSHRARCQLHSPSRALSPHGHTRGAGASRLFPPGSLPALKLSPRQDDGLLCAHHPLLYVPMHETSVSAEVNINEFGRTLQLPN